MWGCHVLMMRHLTCCLGADDGSSVFAVVWHGVARALACPWCWVCMTWCWVYHGACPLINPPFSPLLLPLSSPISFPPLVPPWVCRTNHSIGFRCCVRRHGGVGCCRW